MKLKLYILSVSTFLLTSCGILGPHNQADQVLVQGPPISDIVTPFDNALSCLDGKVSKNITFGVGAILDQTGKEAFTEGGAGKFITQGSGDIVQSALFKAGVTVLNRRDPRIMDTELKWGLRKKTDIVRSNFFLTGSINTLDFLPGGGIYVSGYGGGPEHRHHRILVGLDLSLTETKTGRIVANVPLQKQVVASENRFGIARFFGDVFVELDIGNNYREPLQYVVRQMLNLATFELLTQVMSPELYADCRVQISEAHGRLEYSLSARKIERYLETLAASEKRAQTSNHEPESSDGSITENNSGIIKPGADTEGIENDQGQSKGERSQDRKTMYKKYLD